MANFSESVAEPNPTVGRGFTATVKPTALDDQKISKGLPSGYLTWPWKDPPFLSSVNHLFLWAIYTMATLNNQRVSKGFVQSMLKTSAGSSQFRPNLAKWVDTCFLQFTIGHIGQPHWNCNQLRWAKPGNETTYHAETAQFLTNLDKSHGAHVSFLARSIHLRPSIPCQKQLSPNPRTPIYFVSETMDLTHEKSVVPWLSGRFPTGNATILVGGFNHLEILVDGKDYPIYYGK